MMIVKRCLIALVSMLLLSACGAGLREEPWYSHATASRAPGPGPINQTHPATQHTLAEPREHSVTVYFGTDSDTLDNTARTRLDDFIAALGSAPGKGIDVVGHTDSRASVAHNDKLSQRRANAVRSYLAERTRSPISVRWLGEQAPAADNGSNEGMALNRRVTVYAVY